MFTQREMELLSDGILCLIGNANEAAKLISAPARGETLRAIRAYRDELADLNSKLCEMMDGETEREREQNVFIVCKGGVVQSVSRNANSDPINAYVLDLDDDGEQTEQAYADYRKNIESGEIVPIW